MKPYRVLVTGSRDWPTPAVVWGALNDVRDEALTADRHLVVVHGACPRGADDHAAKWCTTAVQFVNGVTEERHPADWQINGKRAGFIRNAHMVNLGADLCLAFIRNGSRGASHTAALAEQAGIPVRRWTA
ncbi:SLOG family protein [Streptomyces sp. NPDC050416]|uniref:SLOG family protein n=1 Tax=Streptomyces sp. NPDC050416 TaxID=3365611 RepID=UPI0037B326FA